MSKSIIIKSEDIKNRIYTLRGQQVMLDRHLAEFYEVKPIRLREQIKRNSKRFPSDFMFQITEEEVDFMVSQNAIPSKKYLGGHLPYVFTEQGVANISSVLTSPRAIEVNIEIMRAFVAMRIFLVENGQIFKKINSLEKRQLEYQIQTEHKFERVFQAIEESEITPKKGIFFEGQVFDAYLLLSRIIKSASSKIIILDNYIDESILSLLTKRKSGVNVFIYTKTISRQMRLDVQKYNEQYPMVTLKEFKKAHDRFIIVDDTTVYHMGASLKDLGKKWFAFSKMNKEALKILQNLK